ncbi:unnamed protein product [marine sediment metagenome]|uniref:Uncharacterized protein n=1 Tax=marine sediment metagenome TaxID=412755 RepID=X0V941_9ZZZZ
MTYPGEDKYLTELAQRNFRQGQREELARHTDVTFKCSVCGLVWAQPVVDAGWRGNRVTCSYCEATK